MKKTVITLLIVLLIGSLALGAFWSWKHYVILDWTLYPKDQDVLDYRGCDFSQEEYDRLSVKLPQCRILWDVPFQGGLVPSTTQELTVSSLTDQDLTQLSYLSELKTLHAEDCRDYAQIWELVQTRPECQIFYQVELDGQCYDPNATSVTVVHLTDENLSRMDCLPNLHTVRASQCRDYAQLRQLSLAHPDWTITYFVQLGGRQIFCNTRYAVVQDASEAELMAGVPALLQLQSLELINCDADPAVLQRLTETNPGLEFNMRIELGGQQFSLDITEIRLENAELGSLDAVRKATSCLHSLEKLILTDCTIDGQAIDNEVLSAFREECRPNFKVVWRVYCGKVPAMTDDIWFMPIQRGEYYFQHSDSYNLRYCEDMICIDVGHSVIQNVDFAAFMPHLQYLIISDTQVQDISGISNCKELIFFENNFTIIRDLSPLLGCTALEDLNLDSPRYSADMTPVYQMTWLKNLFIGGAGYRTYTAAEEALPNTRVDHLSLGGQTGISWRNLPNYYTMRDILGMYYMY